MEDNGGVVVSRKQWRRGSKFFWPGHDGLDFLTNGYESVFEIDGMRFLSVSWFMWYVRAKMWRPNEDLASLIREAKNQAIAKQLSRRCTSAPLPLMVEWTGIRLKAMARAVLRKFESSEDLSRRLLLTGQDCLLYASRFDSYYGIGFTMKEAPDRVDEWGTNYLGEMLMIVRKRLSERGVDG